MVAGPPEPGPQLLLTELRGDTSSIWAIDPAERRRRRELLAVDHAGGWGLKAAASPDGRLVAYLMLPPDARDAGSQAELWVLDVTTGAPARLGTGLDLLGRPVWAPDSSLVVARRMTPRGPQSDVLFLGYPARGGTPQPLATVNGVDWAGALGWWQHALVYASIRASGSYLHVGDSAAVLLTTGIARDFRLDAAAGRLDFRAVAALQNTPMARADLTTLRVEAAPPPDPQAAEGPLPQPAGAALSASGLQAEPLGTTSDGRLSAVLATRPGGGNAFLAVAGPAGLRPVPMQGYAEFAGWLE